MNLLYYKFSVLLAIKHLRIYTNDHFMYSALTEAERCGYEKYQPSVSREEAERYHQLYTA